MSLLALGSRWTFVGGKGGVGKTTVAASLAVALADAGRSVLALSVDPAHSLGDALGVALGPDPSPIPGLATLRAAEIDPKREQERFLGTHREHLLRLLERGSYLDRGDLEEFIDLTLPGADEMAALFRLMELAGDPETHLVVDTAPTGHTLRLLDLPGVALGWLGALEAMEAKHRAVSLGLAGAYEPDAAAALLLSLRDDLLALQRRLTDPAHTRFVLVTDSAPVVLAETRRYQAELTRRGIALAGIVVNRAGASIPADAVGPGMLFVPVLRREPAGVEGARAFAAAVSDAPPGADSYEPPSATGLTRGGRFEPPADPLLYLVGGKGGVGKSTAAAALALRLADGGRRVLLLSVDPAGSLGEVLEMEVGADARAVAGAPGLFAQQLDAERSWREFRDRYRAEAEELFAGVAAGGAGAGAADREVVARLLDLAPPGVDELMALVQVVDLTEDRPYDALVLDTAPTGHLLRLLELPGVALDWTRAVMRTLLEYREVLGLGGVAERVLELSRDLRGLRALLRDAERCWFLAVALPEALSVPETARLLAALRGLGMVPGALLINRALDEDGVRPGAGLRARELADLADGVAVVGAPDRDRGPVGAEALRRWGEGWSELKRTTEWKS